MVCVRGAGAARALLLAVRIRGILQTIVCVSTGLEKSSIVDEINAMTARGLSISLHHRRLLEVPHELGQAQQLPPERIQSDLHNDDDKLTAN